MAETLKVKLKKLHPNATVPKQATEFAGGWDVTATTIEIKQNDLVICKLGFALEIPKGYKLTLVPRSSLTGTRWVMQNTPGLGDCDYRGEYQIRFRAIPEDISLISNELIYPKFPYIAGDRVGQVYLEKVIYTDFEIVDELNDTVRGEGGYGSTGLL